VPNVVGKEGAAAVSELTTLGFVVTVNEQALPVGDASNGIVLAQSVAAGSTVPPGSAITVAVGKAEAAPIP
jgi:beta-lactam-binding protein with PASTA domain